MTDGPKTPQETPPAGSACSDGLDRRICPGCGTENPKSKMQGWFECAKCTWEWDGPLPTVRQLMKRRGSLGDVHLGKFLKTLLKAI